MPRARWRSRRGCGVGGVRAGTARCGNDTFGYDDRGNTTSKDGGTLSFDRENRLVAAAFSSATMIRSSGNFCLVIQSQQI